MFPSQGKGLGFDPRYIHFFVFDYKYKKYNISLFKRLQQFKISFVNDNKYYFIAIANNNIYISKVKSINSKTKI